VILNELEFGVDEYESFRKKFLDLVNRQPLELRHWYNPDADYDDAFWIDVPMRVALQFWTLDELEAGNDQQDEHGPWATILGDEITLGGAA